MSICLPNPFFCCALWVLDLQIWIQIAVGMAKIARLDCPKAWPDLIPTLISHMSDNSSELAKRVRIPSKKSMYLFALSLFSFFFSAKYKRTTIAVVFLLRFQSLQDCRTLLAKTCHLLSGLVAVQNHPSARRRSMVMIKRSTINQEVNSEYDLTLNEVFPCCGHSLTIYH